MKTRYDELLQVKMPTVQHGRVLRAAEMEGMSVAEFTRDALRRAAEQVERRHANGGVERMSA